jgi:hypothetical protein
LTRISKEPKNILDKKAANPPINPVLPAITLL